MNHKEVEIDTNPLRRLIDVLRDDFGLTGVKEGCGEGECGACSILIDSRLVTSCLIAVGTVHQKEIVTIEGFRKTERFSILSQAFAESGVVQCGFCMPGIIMAAEALLNTNSAPSEQEIRKAMSGNLCRCTGYNIIVEGVLLASEKGKGVW